VVSELERRQFMLPILKEKEREREKGVLKTHGITSGTSSSHGDNKISSYHIDQEMQF
jgi:hypothetical protein